jgi:hypothetical protein
MAKDEKKHDAQAYNEQLVQIINYGQHNLSVYINEAQAYNEQEALSESAVISQMVAATTVIPIIAERRMKGQDSLEGLANGELFDASKTEKLWQEVQSQFKDIYCKVHNLRQGSSLTKCLIAMAYSLPDYSKA